MTDPVRRVVGRAVEPFPAADLERVLHTYERVLLDLGCGDGRHVVERAAAEPELLAIGIDADASRMAEWSRRARRDGPPNVLFLQAAAEELPAALDGTATEIAILFPWGSLLRACVAAEPWLVASLQRIGRDAPVTMVLSVEERDAAAGAPALDAATIERLAAAFAAAGFAVEHRAASRDELRATRSSWARRIGAGTRRPAWIIELSPAARGRAPNPSPVAD